MLSWALHFLFQSKFMRLKFDVSYFIILGVHSIQFFCQIHFTGRLCRPGGFLVRNLQFGKMRLDHAQWCLIVSLAKFNFDRVRSNFVYNYFQPQNPIWNSTGLEKLDNFFRSCKLALKLAKNTVGFNLLHFCLAEVGIRGVGLGETAASRKGIVLK